MRNYVLFVFTLFLGVIVKAQNGDLEKGYFITNSEDTVKCFIKWKKNFDCDELVYYKTALTDKYTFISVSDLNSIYNEERKKLNLIVKMKVYYEYVDPIDRNLIFDDSVRTGSFPLRPVFTGDSLSLFVFHDKTDYFFIYHDGVVEQLLMQYRYLTDAEKLPHVNRIYPAYYSAQTWKTQLYTYCNFTNDKKLYNLSLDSQFSEFDIAKLVASMDKVLSANGGR